MRRLVPAAVFVLGLGVCSSALAQPADDAGIALALFSSGRALAATGDYVHACPKFEAARAVEPWLGIELNLADCYEHIGLTASAWVLFRKVGDEAERAGDSRGSYAKDRAAKLEPVLAHLTIEAPRGAVIRLDSRALPDASTSIVLPVDPGDHAVEASASGRVTWSAHVAAEPGHTSVVHVPDLKAVPPVATITLRAPPTRPPRWPLVLEIAGASGIAASLAIGLDAKLRFDGVHGCDPQLVCSPGGYAEVHEAQRLGNVATVVGGIGIAALVTGMIVRWRSPVTPFVTPSAMGVSVSGSL